MGGACGLCARHHTVSQIDNSKRVVIQINNMPLFKTVSNYTNEDIHKIYCLQSTIGHGYFSKVKIGYKRVEGEDSKYAIKIIAKSNVDKSRHDDFLNEVSILKKLDHPNVLKLYEIYQDYSNYYLVMEYLSGGDIFKKIQRMKSLQQNFIEKILYKVLCAINYCHSIGICHRDIKPENILFKDESENAEIKLVDFGLSKKFNTQVNELMHSFLGTPYFIAPEVINMKYDFNCDMWSIGATAFMLFTGHPPFPEKKREEVLNKIKYSPVNYEKEIWSIYSPQALEFVQALLVKNPKKRLTPEKAINHKFFKNINKEINNNKNIDISILQNMLNFENQIKFKKLVLSLLIKTLPQDNLENLNKTFHAIDINHEGFISLEELATAFKRVGIDLSKEEVTKILNRIDEDKNGHLNYSEFIMASLNLKDLIDETKIKQLFNTFDIEGSGYIKTENVKLVLLRSGREIENLDEIVKMFQELANKDNQISMDDFVNLFMNEIGDNNS
jgi:calcium-dependent protein kinase